MKLKDLSIADLKSLYDLLDQKREYLEHDEVAGRMKIVKLKEAVYSELCDRVKELI
ncbi:hypothetical protein [Dysgonomonas macrotermitis]|uniref:Uncharacterized protein n=1 Tax=Dysgonomonas macrotermitis TaxID=1346286 RepID=A0A1M5E5J5_9BACT|nr:hypothetical protein [Dysgonomonas macrotermitis]SHF74507.1 hypothetical protein SAMN05444362_109155 [Dysgonomonas macrotermitis]